MVVSAHNLIGVELALSGQFTVQLSHSQRKPVSYNELCEIADDALKALVAARELTEHLESAVGELTGVLENLQPEKSLPQYAELEAQIGKVTQLVEQQMEILKVE